MTIAKVEGSDSLVKNTSTGAVVNTNKTEYLQFIRQRELADAKEETINQLKTEVDELKALVRAMMEKIDG